MSQTLSARRPHVYELDPLRGITALGVVAVHVVAFTVSLNTTQEGVQLQNAVVVALHYTRAVFMFLTAFAMVYVYYGKPFATGHFWKRRSIGVLLPYCFWSVLYTWENTPGHSPLDFVRITLFNIATGNGSYQLYYILLTLQFYLILPLFLIFLKQVAGHPWKTLILSFALQLVMFYVDYHFLQKGTTASSGVWQIVNTYQNRFILTYQFYFVLGGITALYFTQVRNFLLRNGVIVTSGFLVVLAVLLLHFAIQVRIYQEPMDYITSFVQPMVVFYTLAVIIWGFWLSCRWTRKRKEDGKPGGYAFWHMLSDASFGIYLLHAFLLTALLKWVTPAMPAAWPVVLRVFLTWFLAAGGATGISTLMLHIPFLSRLVGREHVAARPKSVPPEPRQASRETAALEPAQQQ